jgi:hypothetical protein
MDVYTSFEKTCIPGVCLTAAIVQRKLVHVKSSRPWARHEGVYGSGGIIPGIHNLGTRYSEYSALALGAMHPVPIEYGASWAPEADLYAL